MFSFLQKINPKKHHNGHSDHKSNKDNKGKDTISTSSTLEAVDINTLDQINNNNAKQDNNNLNDNINTTFSLRSKTNNQQAKSPKTHFSRKSNLSLASLSSGYFTTGRFDKKKAAASLGTLYSAQTKQNFILCISSIKLLILLLNYFQDYAI